MNKTIAKGVGMKKYIVIAGTVRSKNDGDLHRISARRLCDLYRVNPSECIFADEDRPETLRGLSDLPVLRPRYDGKYEVQAIEPKGGCVNEEVWLHVPTFTIAIVDGQFGEFKWNGKMEQSFWGLFRIVPSDVHGWFLIGEL